MREPLALVLACVPALASIVAFGNPPKPRPIDPAPAAGKLLVYRDELDHYYVVPKPGAFDKLDDGDRWVFYGDAKGLYQQRVIGSSMDGANRGWTLWAPRAKGMTGASLDVKGDKAQLTCKLHDTDGSRKLVLLAGDEAATVFKKAKLYPVFWPREAHLLARDDDGVYYYVDNLREELGGNGYRVFVGMKGAMKELAMTNIVRDSSGEIFATRTGQLKLIAGKGRSLYWIKGGKRSELTFVDILADRYLVYRELGIYGQLGAVCDDF
ncbi:MAG: hypothetical protein ACM31C_14230 [Acidobacteriota bacterium]